MKYRDKGTEVLAEGASDFVRPAIVFLSRVMAFCPQAGTVERRDHQDALAGGQRLAFRRVTGGAITLMSALTQNRGRTVLLATAVACVLLAGGPAILAEPPSPGPRADPAAVQSGSDTVRVAALERWPPYYRWPEGGEPAGFAVESFQEIATRAGLVPEFHRFPDFPTANEAFRRGGVDVIPNVGDVPSRRSWMSFTSPVQTFPVVVFTRKAGPNLDNLPDLSGRTVGVVRDNVGVTLLADRPAVTQEVYSAVESALFGLLAGEVDAILYPRPVLLALARDIGSEDEIRASDTVLTEVKRAVAVQPGRAELHARLDSAVSAYVGSADYERAYRRWFGQAEPFWTVERVAWTAGVGLFLAVVLLAGWRYRTARRLNRRLRESEREFRQRTQKYERLLTEISDVVTLLDEDGTIVYQSPSIRRVFGYEPDELVGRPVFELVHPQDADEVGEAFYAAVEGRGETGRTVQYRFRHADGSWPLVESTGIVPEGGELGPLAVTRDITDRVEAQQRYENIFDISPVALKLVRFETGEYLEVNQTFEEIFGYSRSELLGGSLSDDDLWETPSRREQIYAHLRGGNTVRNEEVRLRRKDGSMVDGMFSASLLERAGEKLMIGAIQDISALKEVERELEHRSLHDSLTGLANRALLTDRVERGVARAQRHGSLLGLLMLDLDDFKRINDRLGHAAGDRVLVEIARRLEGTLREDDTVARWGGDEFFVVLPEFEAADAMADIKSRIHGALRPPIKVAEESVHLDASIGAVVYGDDGHEPAVQTENPAELIRFASLALHWAREEGRAGFKLFDPAVEVEGVPLMRRERALRDALEEGQIIPHFQPIVRLENREMVGVEALARWQHPERGLVPPAEFIPLAEELGLIGKLGDAIIRQGCQQVAQLKREAPKQADLFIAFNLSGHQFRNPSLVEELEKSVVENGLDPEGVTLEITETALMELPTRVEALRAAGFQVSIDDFGTGYSTFTYLREFNFDALKIDMTFVQGITGSPSDVALVETMLTLGQRLGLQVVAEGIETEEQIQRLKGLGCMFGQGYLFARPGPLDEIASQGRGPEDKQG